jgi:hypothetical protein
MKWNVGKRATLSATLLQTTCIVNANNVFWWYVFISFRPSTLTETSFIGWCMLVTLICRAVCSSFFVYLHVLAFRKRTHVSLGCKSNCLCWEYQQVFPYTRKFCKRTFVTFEWLALLRLMWCTMGSIYSSVVFHFQHLKTNTLGKHLYLTKWKELDNLWHCIRRNIVTSVTIMITQYRE